MRKLVAPSLRRLRSVASYFETASDSVTSEVLALWSRRAACQLPSQGRLFPCYELITHFFLPPSWRRVGALLSPSSLRTSYRGRGPYTPRRSYTACPHGASPPPSAGCTAPPFHESYTWSSRSLLSHNQKQKNASSERSFLQALGWATIAPSLLTSFRHLYKTNEIIPHFFFPHSLPPCISFLTSTNSASDAGGPCWSIWRTSARTMAELLTVLPRKSVASWLSRWRVPTTSAVRVTV